MSTQPLSHPYLRLTCVCISAGIRNPRRSSRWRDTRRELPWRHVMLTWNSADKCCQTVTSHRNKNHRSCHNYHKLNWLNVNAAHIREILGPNPIRRQVTINFDFLDVDGGVGSW